MRCERLRRPARITSTDANAFLFETTGQPFTAKDFRTWHGTVLALAALAECAPTERVAERKANLKRTIAEVAGRLGNTAAVCKRCYIHPAVLSRYSDGTLAEQLASRGRVARAHATLEPRERACLVFLRAASEPSPRRAVRTVRAARVTTAARRRRAS